MENRCAVKVMLNVEEGDWSRVNRPRENEVVDFLKTKKLPKKYKDAKWAEECYELLSEIEYATYMGRENIGPKVYGAGILLRGNPVAMAAGCIFMELLTPLLRPVSSQTAVSLLRKMANRRICALDMKTIHLMRSKNGGTRVIDYGGSWCVRRVTALEDWRASIATTMKESGLLRGALCLRSWSSNYLFSTCFGRRTPRCSSWTWLGILREIVTSGNW